MNGNSNEILIYEKDEILPIVRGAIDHGWELIKLIANLNYAFKTVKFTGRHNTQLDYFEIYYYDQVIYKSL